MEAHPFFQKFPIQKLNQHDFDQELEKYPGELVGVFFWGHDCPNCEIAKNILHEYRQELAEFGLRWFHVNTYEDFDLGVRYGLHGIPTFLFFHGGKRLGKISPFPGSEPFFRALSELRLKFPK